MNPRPSIPRSLLLVSFLSACGGGASVKADTEPPRFFEGFPRGTLQEMPGVGASVYAEASFQRRHAETLGLDLTEKGLLPIQLQIGLRGREQESAPVRLDPDQMDMRFYLPDGTVLPSVWADVAAKLTGNDRLRDKVRRQSLEPGVLPKYENASNALFVYFQLPKKAVVEDQVLTLQSGKYGQAVDVSKGLLTFNVMFENKLKQFYVGVGR